VQIVTRHVPTLVEKARPHIRRDDYGVLTIGPEFDGEIRYVVERVIFADPGYLNAAAQTMKIDPDARARLFEPAMTERLVRNTVLAGFPGSKLVSEDPLGRLVESGFRVKPLRQSAGDE
jgi:hypothetical protein